MATATIKKRTGDWFAETESVTLVLTAEEAAALWLVVRSVSGHCLDSPRGLVLNIEQALLFHTFGLQIEHEAEGELSFKNRPIQDHFQ